MLFRSFGAYGWSGESVAKITEWLKRSGFEIVNDGIKCLWNPSEESIAACVEFGKGLV